MKKSKREHGQRTRAKGSQLRDEKVDLLYSYLQNMGPEGTQFTREEVWSWFENNTLSQLQVNGRRMCDIFGDCLRGNSLGKLRANLRQFNNSDSTSNCGMTNRPDIVANPLDEAAITCSNQDTSDASFHGSSVESVGLQSSYLPTCHFPSVETFGQNSNIVSRVTLEKVQTQASNQANRREPSFQSRDEASKSSRRWKARRLPFPSDSQDSSEVDQWFNREYGGIENIEKLFPTSKEDALEMKPLRIPDDSTWLESYTSLLCNGGKLPPSAGPYHPLVLRARLKGYQRMFIKGWPLLEEPE